MTQRPASARHVPGETGAGGSRPSAEASIGASVARVLDLLACPACLAALRAGSSLPGEDVNALVCMGCGRVYPVEDGIPILLVDRAAPSQAGR